MRRTVRNALMVLATAVFVAVLAGRASGLTFRDIEGKWCTGGGIIQFEPTLMTVVRSADNVRVAYPINRYDYRDATIVVYWVRENAEVSTEYAEFSSDRRTMTQLQSKDGPRRELYRCG